MQRKNVLFTNKKHVWQNYRNSCVDMLVNWAACFKGRYYLIQLSCNLNLKISSNKPDRLLGALLACGLIHKVRTLRFRNFRPPSFLYLNIHFQLITPTPSMSLRILVLRKIRQRYILWIIINQRTIKNVTKWRNYHTKPSENVSNHSTKKRTGIEFAFLNCTGRLEWIILAIWLVHFVLFLIFNKPAKNNLRRTYTYSWTNPSPIWASTLLAEPALLILSVRILWMPLFLAHLAHSFRSFQNYDKNFQLVFHFRVFTIVFHCRSQGKQLVI